MHNNQSCWSNKLLLNATIKQLLIYQTITLLIVIIAFGGFGGKDSGISALLGALAWFLPNFYFTRRVFAALKKGIPQLMLKEFYLAEFYKLLISAFLLILILKLFSVVVISFISGYIIALFSCWVISVFVVMGKHL